MAATDDGALTDVLAALGADGPRGDLLGPPRSVNGAEGVRTPS
jgi:hypothetical protein